MKKAYISPELELIRFVPTDRLADNSVDGDDVFDESIPMSDPNYDFGMPL